VFSIAKLSSVYKLSIEQLYVKDFEDTLNKAFPHLWPMRGKKVVDLRNGQIGTLEKEHLFCFAGPRMYTPKPSYPVIDKLMASFMCGNKQMVLYLRLKMGLFLTGELLREIDEFSGNGLNGKSTWYKLLQKVMGEFFALIPKDIIITNSNGAAAGAASPQWRVLQNVRLAVFDEVEDNERVNARNVKRLANGDPTTSRGLYQGDYHCVTPKCQVVICVNKDLVYDSTDTAMTDRMVITPWNARFEKKPGDGDHKQDDSYIDDIIDHHLDDLFSYMVDAAIDFYKGGKVIERPQKVLDKTAAVNDSMDSVSQFVQDCCKVDTFDREAKVSPSDLFAAYTTWISIQDMSSKKGSRAQFPKAIIKATGASQKKRNGARQWIGIKIA
jgi:putative DNA primase/helicase